MRRLLVAAAVGSLLVAGCSKAEETSTTSTTAPATSAPTTTEKESPGTTKKKPGTTTTTKKKSESGDPKNPDSEYCQRAQEIADRFAEGDALDPIEDPGAFSAFLGEAAAAAEELVDVAPESIEEDWQLMADTFGQLAAVEPDKVFEELMGLGTEIEDAGDRIDEVTIEECGFPIGTNSSPDDEDLDTTDTTRADGDAKITIDGIQAFLDDSYGSESWVEDLDTWSVSTFTGETTVTVGSPSPSDAVAACDAINDFAGGMTPELVIEINDADGVLLAQKPASATACSAA